MINGMIIRILMALFMLPLTALFTHDPVIIVVAGAFAGVFVYFVTWTIQLAKINKTIPVNKAMRKEEIEKFKRTNITKRRFISDDYTNPAHPHWRSLRGDN